MARLPFCAGRGSRAQKRLGKWLRAARAGLSPGLLVLGLAACGAGHSQPAVTHSARGSAAGEVVSDHAFLAAKAAVCRRQHTAVRALRMPPADASVSEQQSYLYARLAAFERSIVALKAIGLPAGHVAHWQRQLVLLTQLAASVRAAIAGLTPPSYEPTVALAFLTGCALGSQSSESYSF